MRKNRNKPREQKQQGLNTFVSLTFHEVKKKYPKAVKRNYPTQKYEIRRPKGSNNSANGSKSQGGGIDKTSNQKEEEKKKLKWKPYPFQFKKDFFEIIREYARVQVAKPMKKKLPFWAPPSCNVQLRTINKKVKEIHNNILRFFIKIYLYFNHFDN